MPVLLFDTPGYQSYDIRPLDFGGLVTPALGGPQQRINRLGSRWGLTVRLPRMRQEAQGRQWIGALSQGLQEGVILRWPQTGFTNTVNDCLVNGANQIGSILNIDGITPGVIARFGQFFEVSVAGGRTLYMVRDDTVANGSGQMALPIFPMIRKSPPDNAAVIFSQPRIDGFLQDDSPAWTVDVARTTGLEFTVFERQ